MVKIGSLIFCLFSLTKALPEPFVDDFPIPASFKLDENNNVIDGGDAIMSKKKNNANGAIGDIAREIEKDIKKILPWNILPTKEDPEVHMGPVELITSKGYPCETHTLTTSDGYILTLHRIPHGLKNKKQKMKQTVLLQHGLEGAGTNWITNLANQSLGFILADEGYDVWLGNIRGTTASKTHTTLSNKSLKYWDFSFTELAKIDLPAMLNYIKDYTEVPQAHYVGHSQGTMMGFLGFENPETASLVKGFHALGPVAHVKHISGFLGKLAEWVPLYPVVKVMEYLGHGEFLAQSKLFQLLVGDVCHEVDSVCENAFFALFGVDYKHFNKTRIPVYVTHSPGGTSVKNIYHFTQLVRSGEFRDFDYGYVGNMRRYGQAAPPSFDPSLLTVPITYFTAAKDVLADPIDTKWLRSILKTVIYSKNLPDYEHVDFIWAVDAKTEIYDDLLKYIKKIDSGDITYLPAPEYSPEEEEKEARAEESMVSLSEITTFGDAKDSAGHGLFGMISLFIILCGVVGIVGYIKYQGTLYGYEELS